MGFIYGLAVFLVIFEGIIIQCDGGGVFPWIQETKKSKSLWSTDLIEMVLSKTNYQSIRIAELFKKIDKDVAHIAINRMVPDRIIQISSMPDDRISEYYQNGDLFLKIGPQKELNYFFNKFGDQVKKIDVMYLVYPDERIQLLNKLSIQYIERCAKNLEELRVKTFGDDTFWKEISNILRQNGTIFPEVKRFQMEHTTEEKEFKLNLIFPKLEYLTLNSYVSDKNCLKNVTGLKELTLKKPIIEEHQFEHIFKNNKNMRKIFLSKLENEETLHWISKYLPKLESLGVKEPGENFIFRKENGAVYTLPSVIHFYFEIGANITDLFKNGDLSFVMPKLKCLTLDGNGEQYEIFHLLNRFEKLEKVELLVKDRSFLKCISRLKHIKEFTTTFSGTRFEHLKYMFDNFDEHSELQILKFIDVYKYDPYAYRIAMKDINENTMNAVNNDLETNGKSTWILSQGEHIETGKKWIMFERVRPEHKSGKK